MADEKIPNWLAELSEEDYAFIKRFILASGSLKELARPHLLELADLVAVAHGQGRFVLSTLRLLEQLGRDPVADRLLFNIIRWATKLAKDAQ